MAAERGHTTQQNIVDDEQADFTTDNTQDDNWKSAFLTET